MPALQSAPPSTLASLLAAFVASCAFEATATSPPPPGKPNFVVILADDLGYGDLGCYGGAPSTPHLDALAASGLRLTDYHSNGAVCSPTRAALLTGCYQHRFGIEGVVTAAKHRETGLDPGALTIAEHLRTAGYTSALFGKWHLGYDAAFGPPVQGFDEFRGFVSGNVDYVSHIDQVGHEDWWRDGRLEADEGYSTDLVTDYGVDFLRRRGGEPFFLYLAHEAPHYPYQGRGDAALRKPGDPGKVQGAREDKAAAYAEIIAALDDGVGRILAELEALGLRERTYVFFLSDNGPAAVGSSGPWRGKKGTVWEGGHRVPGLIAGPGIAPRRSAQTVMGMDVAPTLLRLAAGAEATIRFDGIDLSPLLFSDATLPPRDLLWTHDKQAALRRGTWKLVLPNANVEDATPQLFDLATDPAEADDRAAELPDRARAMLEDFRRMRAELTAGVTRRT